MAGSRTLNGGLKTSVVGDTVVVSRTGLGSSVPAGTKVDIMLSDIINPGKEGDSYQLTLRLKSDRNAVLSKQVTGKMSIKSRAIKR